MKLPTNATYHDADTVDERPGFYYVSIIDGKRWGLLAGPYTSHQDAIAAVKPAKDAAYRVNPADAAFASFGTCRLEDNVGPGVLTKVGLL